MSVDIKGIKELEKRINDELTSRKAAVAINNAINKGGDKVADNLKAAFNSFADTGDSRDEIVRSNARMVGTGRELKIGWDGPKGKWRFIHLNEFGYTKGGKQFRPRGMGVIARTVNESKDDYFNTVYKEMKQIYD